MKIIKQNKKIIIFSLIVLVLFIILTITNSTYATIDPSDYDPSDTPISQGDIDKVKTKINPIIGAIRVVGIVVAVVTLTILGIKYMMASVSEKAEYKKVMIPYLIGAFLSVSITQLLSVLIKLITNNE